MKLTWFGDDTFRIHAAGAMVVVTGLGELPGVDRAELVSGADLVVDFAVSAVPVGDWKPRPPLKMLEADEVMRAPEVVPLEGDTLVLDSDGEAPLVLARGAPRLSGRWVGQAVIVLSGTDLAARGKTLLEQHAPRLIALAGADADIDAAFESLRGLLDGTGLVALERALAVEV